MYDLLKCWWAWMRCQPWLTVTGVVGLVVSVGTIIGFRYSIALARRNLKKAKREEAIENMVRKIEALDAEVKRTKGFSVSITELNPAPDEDPAIVAEAWRRFQQGKRTSGTKGRFG
jgi:hypothetical protein